jgi:hypothetical protein
MAMGPIPVIEPLDEPHRGSTGLLPSIEMVMMIEIVLEDREERFGHRVDAPIVVNW